MAEFLGNPYDPGRKNKNKTYACCYSLPNGLYRLKKCFNQSVFKILGQQWELELVMNKSKISFSEQ